MFENKKIFVLGMARSGYNVAKLLADKNEIIVTDKTEQDENKIMELKSLGVKFIQTNSPSDYFDESFDMLIKNPGIIMSHDTIQMAINLNKPVFNEMEVAYHFIPEGVTIIGVTGSNGKTTTTTMIYELLKGMNKSVVLGGNIGYPLSEVVGDLKSGDILLLEISDHQLINFKDFKTNISVLTNICPTHLDFHGSYENYMMAKKRIFNNQIESDLAIINFTNEDSMEITKDIVPTKVYFNNDTTYVKDNAIYVNNEKIINLDDIKVKGMHNYENIMAALLVINEFGIDKDVVYKFLNTFKGVEHRIEFVCEKNGVNYYNDSKATNPTSTVVALSSFNRPVHLILGGMERGQDFHELDSVINNVKCIYAIGEVSDRILNYANEVNITAVKCDILKVAIDKIKENVSEGEVVLLSPACASWDQYAKFEDRGDEFKKYCEEIK